MIKLKNIEIENGVLTCQIFPEDSEFAGNIKIDAVSNEIISFNLPLGYEWCKNHLEHARTYLIELYKSKNAIPQEKIIMWC